MPETVPDFGCDASVSWLHDYNKYVGGSILASPKYSQTCLARTGDSTRLDHATTVIMPE